MLYTSFVSMMWPLSQTGNIKGVVWDQYGKSMNLTGHTVTVLIAQAEALVEEVSATINEDIVVAERTCPAPTLDYPNDELIFGDASFDFDAVLQPGNYIHFRRTSGLDVWSRQIQFVNPGYVTLHIEVPDPIDSSWKWSASQDMPREAERGIYYFEPTISDLAVGPYQAQLMIETPDGDILYSEKINGYVTEVLNP